MKIFGMNECDWVAAETLDEAMKFYKEFTGITHDEDAFDDPVEMTDKQMDRFRFNDNEAEPPTVRSFREQLNKMLTEGEKFPAFFASTEY